MRDDVQAAVRELWPRVTTENLGELSDIAGFRRDFNQLFGFDVEGVDYDAPVETDVSLRLAGR
jgi:enoyl-[acyl-carrier protein] reductase/trans-2-enoyl-CoA reductase (NAD+)